MENGEPAFLAGKSGIEIAFDVVFETTGKQLNKAPQEHIGRSREYWIGWAVCYYQWNSARSFSDIFKILSFDDLQNMYYTLHEADIHKSYEVLDVHFANGESKLKTARKHCGMTQEALANESGVSLNTIRAYERKSKDLNKAGFDIVMRLAKALKCEVSELID